MKLKQRILPFYQAIPKLLLFQLVSFVILSVVTWAISSLCNLLLGLSGKAAFTSGDLGFFFTHWQGYAILLLVLMLVASYIAVELNALIFYCSGLMEGKKPSVWRSIGQGFAALKKYLNPRGMVIILYAAVLSPLLGLVFSISLTSSFYIPRFIMSVIESKPLLLTGYIIVMALLFVIAVIYCFILHGALPDNMTMKEASVNSRRLIKRNLKNFIFEMLCFLALGLLTFVLVTAAAALPLLIVQFIPMGETAQIFWSILFVSVLFMLLELMALMFVSFFIIKLTMLYKKYREDGKWEYREQEKKHHPFVITAAVLSAALCVLFAVVGTNFFDQLFHTEITTEIVAHRAGGFEAPENTVKGIETAYELGAKGCEIDIQRTSDGYYVINHDADFSRVAGVSKTPNEMTLEEVRKLRVDGEPVPTLEEMLEASRDKVTLFVELKGETADNQMADDAVRIIREKGMENQTVLISLKFDILEYIEQKYPQMQTGYLAFISFGQIENTPFDYLALEEEISTDETIEAVHSKGKKLMVWTVNEEDSIEQFMTSEADAIITDAVKLSGEMKKELSNRTPLDIILREANSIF